MKRAGTANNSSGKNKRKKLVDFNQKCGDKGIIESISLCNFMCHDNLEFKFGPHINFIIGQNGSGKSAILTAIILALGGRSSVTGRYPNIKGFIKTGKQKAKIEVILKNSGDHPYKEDLYGQKIAVVREINCDGVSAYKLKSSTGKIISTHKEELSNILTALDIQIENPVSALTQETSRTFLTSRKPDKLYQFFYQGTCLEMLEKGYNNVQIMKEDAASDLQRKKEMLPQLEKELKSLKKILDTSAKISDYKQELMWAGVIELERRYEKKKEEYLKAVKELKSYQKEHENCKKKLAKMTADLDEFQKKRDECDAVMTTYREKLVGLKTERAGFGAVLRNLEGKLSSFKREERTTAEEMLSLQNNINENLLKDQNDLNEHKRRREKEIQILEQKLPKCLETQRHLDQERTAKMNLQMDLNAKSEVLKSEINSHKFNLNRQKQELLHSQNALKNKVNVFGDQTQNVLNEIQKQVSRFSKLPIGPIGMYVGVKDQKWAAAIEECISQSILQSFCCDNSKDSVVLKEILKKYYDQWMPSILISKFSSSVYNVKKYEVQSRFPTVLDMLTIHDPVIINSLIDMASIESKILIDDMDTAVDLMLHNPPKNCTAAFLLDCSTICVNPFRQYCTERRSRKCLLSSVEKGEINTLEKDIRKFEMEINAKESELQGLRNIVNQIPTEIKELDKKFVESSVLVKRINHAIEELRLADDPKDRHCMEEDLQQLQNEYERKKADIQSCDLEVKEYSCKIAKVQEEMNLNKELLQEERTKYNDLCSELNSCVREKETLASGVKKFEKEVKDCEHKIIPLGKETENYQRYYETAALNAEEVCPRIDTDRSCDVLRSLLSEVEKIVEEHSNCNKEELQQKYKEKCRIIKEARRILSDKEKNLEQIDKMYKRRRENFRSICATTQNCINMAYMVHIQEYYSGRLVFDNKARTLTLEAHPNKSGTKLKNKGGKCSILSGGERSFVTIAFLLAMWDRMRSPFKILDEYDVFMDSNNRKLSIDLLIGQAEYMADSQFIFLSPLDLPQISHSPFIKIHKMPAPERAQDTTL